MSRLLESMIVPDGLAMAVTGQVEMMKIITAFSRESGVGFLEVEGVNKVDLNAFLTQGNNAGDTGRIVQLVHSRVKSSGGSWNRRRTHPADPRRHIQCSV